MSAGNTESQVLATLEQLLDELGSVRSGPVTTASDIERDLGLDSLGRIEFAARLEVTLGLVLDEQALFAADTVGELIGTAVTQGDDAVPGAGASPAAPPKPVGSDPDVAAPATSATTLLEALHWHVKRSPERTHVRFYDDETDGELLSYRELWDEARCAAGGLAQAGLEPGDTAVIMLATGRAYLVTFFAILMAGGIPVPIYPPVRQSQLEDHLNRQGAILRNAQATVLVTEAAAIGVARLLTSQVETLRTVVSADGLGNQPIADIAQPRPQDIGFLQYTSGSTGDPKGVVLTHANLMANVRADGAGLAVTPDDVFVSWLPLYHDMGLIGAWFGSLYHGIPLVLMSPLAFMSRPQRWLRAIHRFGGTLSAAPNFAYELCVRRVRDSELASLDLSRWRLSLNGAEAISPATLNAFSEKFAVCGLSPTTVLPVYGLAECAVGLAFSPLGREPLFDRIDREHLLKDGSARPASADTKDALTLVACGGALPGHQIRIVDTGGREAPERQQGRLQFCGPSATIGYYRAPQATAQLIQDGWHETGDLAYVAAGELYITGRSKDVIIRAGRNIHPVELEDAVSTLEGVRGGRVAAFGVPDERGGTERVVVVAETRLRDEERREMLRRDVNNLGIALIGGPVDEVVLAAPGTILRTSSGKVRRLACRDRYVDGQIGAKPLPAWVALGRLALAGVFPQCRRVTRVGLAWLWAVFAWFSLALASVVTFATIMAPMRLDTRWRFAHCVARGLVRWLGIELEVEDQRGEVCTQRRVFACNHQSYLDGFIIMASFREPVRFLAKAELVDVAPVRIMLERLGTRFVRRLDPAAAVADLVDVMAESEDVPPLFVFPEGTFKRMPGVLPFRLGAFVAAQDAGADVIPVAIRGTRSMLRSGSWFPRRGKARVVIGKPIPAGPLLEGEAASDWQRAVALRDTTRSFILGYCDEPDLAHESNRVKSQGR